MILEICRKCLRAVDPRKMVDNVCPACRGAQGVRCDGASEVKP